MRVMLVRPKPHKDSLGLADLMTCEPLELEYVAALCKKLGHDVVVEDMILERKPLDKLVRKERSKMEREAESDRLFELKQQKKKEKHKGH